MQKANKLITSAMLIGALQGCGPQQTQQHEGLGAIAKQNLHLLDNRGEETDIHRFLSRIDGKFTTVSFMFTGCGSTCPRTASELAELSLKYPDMKHIVISLLPHSDIEKTSDGKTRLETSLELWGLTPGKNVYTLYPSENGKRDYVSLFESSHKMRHLQDSLQAFYDRKMVPLQQDMGMIAPTGNYNDHGSGISLYGRQGELLGYSPLSEVQTRIPAFMAEAQKIEANSRSR